MFGLKIVKESYLNSLLSEIDSLKNTCIAFKDEISNLEDKVYELESKPQLLTDVAEAPLKEVKTRKTVKKTEGKTTKRKVVRKNQE